MKLRVLPLVLVSLAEGAAFADPVQPATGDPAAAQVLFYDARQLMEKGKYVEACPKLEESLRLDQGLGTQYNLADCNEHLGKLAAAWAGFLAVAAESKSANQPDREKLARKRAAAVEPRLSKLVVDVPATAQNVEVKRDGVLLGTAAWGTAIPVDAGTHRVLVTAPGKQWETTVVSSEGKTARVAVPRDLPALALSAPQVASSDVTKTIPPDSAVTSFPAPVVEHAGATQRAAGWVVAGAGVVGIGIGAGFGIASIGKRDESRDHCVVDACDQTGVGLRDDAMRNGNIATIATIAGGAAVLGGLLLVVTAPKAIRERTGNLRATPTAAAGGGGFMLQGTFQ